ncbi:hypothetical protein V6N12_023858 [Hibiscus sabdariffa]|uniref:Uncharacterized protein n=1 Tax=Hibiscus sabdariffa TaxID=183260 RepID=A0ABR2FZ40_9ROSI
MDISQVRISPTMAFGKALLGKRKVTVCKSKHFPELRKDVRNYNPMENEGVNSSSEARKALEICNSVGLHFAVSNEMVCSRMEQIERENANQV